MLELVPAIDAYSEAGLRPAGPVRGRIEFRHVTFAYPSRPDQALYIYIILF